MHIGCDWFTLNTPMLTRTTHDARYSRLDDHQREDADFNETYYKRVTPIGPRFYLGWAL